MKKQFKYIYISLICILTTILPIKVEAESININKSKTTIGIGYSETLKYSISEDLYGLNIIWTSSNNNVVTVNNSGKITGVSEGSAIITVSVGRQKSTCKVTVSSNYIPITGIKLNKTSTSILVGSSETITKTITPSNANNTDVTWTSSNTSIATVENGKITAKKVGTAIITATAGEYSATCKVTVIDKIALKKITLNKENITIKEKETANLNITYTPSNATNKKVTWKSSNNNIATVDSSGKITGVSKGTVTITAISNDGGYTATCKVTIEEISKKVTSVSLDKTEIKLKSGDQETLKVNINPSYAENKNVTWSSMNENIASVENGVVTAKSPGITEIKVITEDENKEAICKVIVESLPIESISFNELETTMYLNNEKILSPITHPENSFIENPIWTSSDEHIASVENGIVKALAIGQTTITVSNQEGTITASINIIVIDKPKEKLNITIEGYDLNFDPTTKDYSLQIGSESSLTIKTNVSEEKVTINGNKNLKNGSIITITITDEEKVTYVINIKKKGNYTIYFIAIISILLLLNLIRILVKNKKKS